MPTIKNWKGQLVSTHPSDEEAEAAAIALSEDTDETCTVHYDGDEFRQTEKVLGTWKLGRWREQPDFDDPSYNDN